MKAIELTTTEFQTRIYDFRANPEWKYEGDLPAVIDFLRPVVRFLQDDGAGYGVAGRRICREGPHV